MGLSAWRRLSAVSVVWAFITSLAYASDVVVASDHFDTHSAHPVLSSDFTRLPSDYRNRLAALDGSFRRAKESARSIIGRELSDTEYLLLSFDSAGTVAYQRIIEKQTILRVGPTLAENRPILSADAQHAGILSTAVRSIDGIPTPKSRFTLIDHDLSNIRSFALTGRHGFAILTNNGVMAVEDVVGESKTLFVAWPTVETASFDILNRSRQFAISSNGIYVAVLARPVGDSGLVPSILRFTSTDRQIQWESRIPATDTMITLRIADVSDQGEVKLEGLVVTRPLTRRTIIIDRSGMIKP